MKGAALAKRALKLLGTPDYVVTDIVTSRPKKRGKNSPRPHDVVFVEQRWMGIPVFNGRRSVVFANRTARVTGKHLAIRSVLPVLPEIDAANAVRVALRRRKNAIEAVSASPGFDRFSVFRVAIGAVRRASLQGRQLDGAAEATLTVRRASLQGRQLDGAAKATPYVPTVGDGAAKATPYVQTVGDGAAKATPYVQTVGDGAAKATPYVQTLGDGAADATLTVRRASLQGRQSEVNATPYVTAQLVVYGTGRARLAWLITADPPESEAVEVVVDAGTGKVLHKRELSLHAGDACVAIAPEAGGPAAGGSPLKFAVDNAWLDKNQRRIACVKPNGDDVALPPLDGNGDFCGAPVAFEQTAIDGLVIANLGLDLLMNAGGLTQGRIAMTLINAAKSSDEAIAVAIPSLNNPQLRFTAKHPSKHHAASDPAVVLHELAHLVLSRGVGGVQFAAPFETTGESGAVMEGMADFLGMTLWNSIRRVPVGQPDIEIFGDWLFTSSKRDYADFIANPGTAPKFPFNNAGSNVHKRGMVLCLALWLTRKAIMTQPSMDADKADEVMWQTVCASLPLMPHQDSRPHFCCVAEALLSTIPSQFKAALNQALTDRNIPTVCPH